MSTQNTIRQSIKLIQNIPFTRAIFLTGSQAEGRANMKSDIDFFVQVKPGFLWSTRFFVTDFMQLAGLRRTNSNIAGKICLNWFATFNAPAKQPGRVHKVLWVENKRGQIKTVFENLLAGYMGKLIEKMLKKYQISRIERDPRTHAPGSQVRYSDTELGFHPLKRN